MELPERVEQLERELKALRPELSFPSTATLEHRLRWLKIVLEEMRAKTNHGVYAETLDEEKLKQLLGHTVYIKQDRITLHSLTADPASCVAGDMWFRSDLGIAKLAIDAVVANAKVVPLNISDANAAVGQVLASYTFYAGGLPKKTGTMPTVALAADNTAYPTGYHAGAANLQAVDSDLTPANIKSGVNIFGYVGTVIPGGTETNERLSTGTLGAGATYAPAVKGQFVGLTNIGSGTYPTAQYYSTSQGAWYTPISQARCYAATAVGDGSNLQFKNDGSYSNNYAVFRHFYSTGTYQRLVDQALPAATAYTPAVSGVFAYGSYISSSTMIGPQAYENGAWAWCNDASTQTPWINVIGDGTNLRFYNFYSVDGWIVVMHHKLT